MAPMPNPNAKHKRSAAVGSLPFPTSSSGAQAEQARWSGESLAPSDGYSGLFTSGMMPSSQSPSPRKAPLPSAATHLSTPTRGRRRSSILASPSSPAAYKSGGLDGGVERALDSVMRSLKIAMSTTPRTPRVGGVREESRWSSSTGSPASLASTSESFWRSRKSGESARPPRKSGESARPPPRKSGESVRSRMTARSGVSKKGHGQGGRKSGETERGLPMEVDMDVVPPVPATPRRSVVGDLARRLGLTPKRRFATPPVPTATTANTASVPLPPRPTLPLPPPPPPARNDDLPIPRKSSLSTLRSLGKKGSTTTLRSVKTINASSQLPTGHPFALPPAVPTTPGKARTAKSSIGPPKYVPVVSPSKFLDHLPRPAPITPKRETSSVATGAEATPDLSMTTDVDSSFASSAYIITPAAAHLHMPSTPRINEVYTPNSKSPSVAKSRRLLGLLPRKPTLENLPGATTETPSLRKKRSYGPGAFLGFNASTDSPALPSMPPSLRTRQPLGVIGQSNVQPVHRFSPHQAKPRGEGHGRPLATPFTPPSGKENASRFFADMSSGQYSYSTPPLAIKRGKRVVTDFTASPMSTDGDVSMDRVLMEMEMDASPIKTPPVQHGKSESKSSLRSGMSGVSGVSGVSLVTHETVDSGRTNWELERYLESEQGHS